MDWGFVINIIALIFIVIVLILSWLDLSKYKVAIYILGAFGVIFLLIGSVMCFQNSIYSDAQ